MIEEIGDIWSRHHDGAWIIVPTNGYVRPDGGAVMGPGLAHQAATRYPRLVSLLGEHLAQHGNHLHIFDEFRLVAFPVKTHWHEAASIALIQRSAHELEVAPPLDRSYHLPRVGCGNGRLVWPIVRPILASVLLSDRFTIVWNEGEHVAAGDTVSRATGDDGTRMI